MITMKVTVQPLPHHHSLGTFYGMGLGGGSQAFSWTCAVPPREVGLARKEGRSQRSSCSLQASTWLVVTAVGSQGRVRGLPDPWPVQSHPELWSGWGRVPTPGHSSGQDTHTWVAKGPGSRERGRGPGERGVQGRGVGGGLHLWASWRGDRHRVSGRYRASAKCTFVIVNSTGGDGDRPWWPEQRRESALKIVC